MNAPPDSPLIVEDAPYEVIAGQRVYPPRGARESHLASLLAFFLERNARAEYGRAGVERLYDLSNGRLGRPNVSFVSYQRWPRQKRLPDTDAWAVVPDLAVEVVSLATTYQEITQKIAEYFRAGVTHCWVVDPGQEQVNTFTSPTQVRILTRADELTAEPLLPGFRLSLSELFVATED